MSKRFSFLLITCALICSSYACQDFDNPEVWQKTYTQAKQDFPKELDQHLEDNLGLGTMLCQNLEETFREGGLNATLEEGWEEVGSGTYNCAVFASEETIENSKIKAFLESPEGRLNVNSIKTKNGLFDVYFEKVAYFNRLPSAHFSLVRTFRYNVPSFKDIDTK